MEPVLKRGRKKHCDTKRQKEYQTWTLGKALETSIKESIQRQLRLKKYMRS